MMSGSPSSVQVSKPLEEVSKLLGCRWENIELAQQKTRQITQSLSSIIEDVPGPDSDTSVVVNGSIAREECTQGSDLDWTLLVDAQANADHQENLLGIRDALNVTDGEGKRAIFKGLGLKEPGTEGTFGTLFSVNH